MRLHPSSPWGKLLIFFLFLSITLIETYPVHSQVVSEGTQWSNPIRVPTEGQANPKYPSIAVDSQGNVHLIWVNSLKQSLTKFSFSIQYSMWNGTGWSLVNDITPANQTIQQPELVVDDQDRMDLLYTSDPQFNLLFSQAFGKAGYSAANWSQPFGISESDSSVHSDIAVQQNHVYVVYEDVGDPNGLCPSCTGIYYRVSPDRGGTWSTPQLLYSSGVNSAHPRIEADRQGYLYSVWDEGVDPLLAVVGPSNGALEILKPDADRWTAAMKIDYPNQSNIQTTVGADGKGGVLLVWRTSSAATPGIYYMASNDFGNTWSSPQTIPGIISGPLSKELDRFSMATDSNGHIHLLAVGYPSETASIVTPVVATGTPEPEAPGLYHLEWDGQNWSVPTVIYRGGWFPFGPKLAIYGGNRLFATWYTQDNLLEAVQPTQIFLAAGVSGAPFQAPILVPTQTMVPSPTAFPTTGDTQTPAQSATLDSSPSQARLESIYSETDTYKTILFGLIPVVTILILVSVFAQRRK